MELTKKTTILFPEPFYRNLVQMAASRGTSVGKLVRDACAKEYRIVANDDAAEAVQQLAEMSLPVSDVDTMKRESVPTAEELLP